MHPMNVQTPPGLMQVATQAQDMAKHTKQEKMAVVFQTVWKRLDISYDDFIRQVLDRTGAVLKPA